MAQAWRINIIGAGKLGKTLGYLLNQHQQASQITIINKHDDSSTAAANFIGGSTTTVRAVADLPLADIWFITSVDAEINSLCQALAAQACLKPGNIVLHCSGVMSSAVLSCVKPLQCYIASIHPLFSFADPKHAILHFQNTWCAFEGDAEAESIVKALFSNIGARVFTIESDQKSLYHAASVLASNYLVTLSAIAKGMFKTAGVEDITAEALIHQLMSNTLNNIDALHSHQKALTGPLQRGDIITIENHIDALSDHPNWLMLYKILGQLTMPLTTHSDSLQQQLMTLLSK